MNLESGLLDVIAQTRPHSKLAINLATNFAIAIHYQLIRVKDNKVLADFIAAGMAGDAQIAVESLVFDYHNYFPGLTQDLSNFALSEFTRLVDSGKLVLIGAAS